MYVYVITVSVLRYDDVLYLLYQCYEYMMLLENENTETVDVRTVTESLRQLIIAVEALLEIDSVIKQGRPRIAIDCSQLTYFVESGFRVKDIAEIFCCSKRTIERRMAELSLKASDYSIISDDDLDLRVSSLLSNHRQCGEKTVTGFLRSQGHKVQRQRVRDSIHRVDPMHGCRAKVKNCFAPKSIPGKIPQFFVALGWIS